MTAKESACLAQMQDLGYSLCLVTTAMRIISESKEVQEEILLFLYDKHPSEKKFIKFLAEICEGSNMNFLI